MSMWKEEQGLEIVRLGDSQIRGANNTVLRGNLNQYKNSIAVKELTKRGVDMESIVKMASRLDGNDDDDTETY